MIKKKQKLLLVKHNYILIKFSLLLANNQHIIMASCHDVSVDKLYLQLHLMSMLFSVYN